MVSANHNPGTKQMVAVSIDTASEEMRALLGLFDHLNELMGDWSRKSKSASDATVIAVSDFYQTLCRDLCVRMSEFQDAVAKAALPLDLSALRKAREHLNIVAAVNAADILRAEKDVQEGRTMTLEQMRRELRNPAH